MNKSVKYFSIILGLVIWPLFCSTLEAANLVLNPGFETSARTPLNWTITGPVPKMVRVTGIDSHVQYSGSFGLKMESTNPNCHGRAVQTVEITGGKTYLFIGRFKTEKVITIPPGTGLAMRVAEYRRAFGVRTAGQISSEPSGIIKLRPLQPLFVFPE